MWISDGDDDLLGEAAEPAPAGWTDDPRQMKGRAKQLFDAGDYQGACDILQALHGQGIRHPVSTNLAISYARLGDLASAAQWMAEALDDPSNPHAQPLGFGEATGRGGLLEAFYQWSRGQQYP
jgi:hypothetical protein